MKPYAPLGLLYLSSYLRSRGFEAEIYDSTFGSRQELFRLLDEGPAGSGDLRHAHDARQRIGIAQRARAMAGSSCWAVRSP